MKLKPRSLYKRLIPLTLIGIAAIYYGCKKSNFNSDDTIASPAVAEAKLWYDAQYPQLATTDITKVTIQSDGKRYGKTNLSRVIKPNWQRGTTYNRLNSDVVETPVEKLQNVNFSLGKDDNRYDPKNTKASFLMLKKNGRYTAYVMMIVADSAYMQNDTAKLNRNTYRKRDANFSGMILYFTPKGDFVNSYIYKNGKVVKPEVPGAAAKPQNTSAVKVNTSIDYEAASCTHYYWIVRFIDDGSIASMTYLFSICDSDGGGGAGGGSPSEPPCPQGTQSIKKPISINTLGDDEYDDGTGGGGFPPPNPPPTNPPPTSGSPCVVAIDIRTDTLKKNFPCAKVLIIDGLKAISSYYDFTAPFETALKPDLVWSNKSLAWNPNGGGATQLGSTQIAPGSRVGLSSLITLNTEMLKNSSKLLIASTAIHETIHGYLNYSAEMGLPPGQEFLPMSNWMLELDSFYTRNALPANYNDHFQMMSDYFGKSIGILATFDHNSHTQKQYAMTMLYGLDNAGENATVEQKNKLAQLVTSIKLTFAIDDFELNAFWKSQLKATAAEKLPTSGCIEY